MFFILSQNVAFYDKNSQYDYCFFLKRIRTNNIVTMHKQTLKGKSPKRLFMLNSTKDYYFFSIAFSVVLKLIHKSKPQNLSIELSLGEYNRFRNSAINYTDENSRDTQSWKPYSISVPL